MDSKDILYNVSLDIPDLIEELRFDYQHSPNYNVNPTAFDNVNVTSGDWTMFCCPNHQENRASCGVTLDPPYNCNCFYCGPLGTIAEVVEIAFGLNEGEGLRRLLAGYMVEEKRPELDVEGIIRDGRGHNEIPCLPIEILGRFDMGDPNAWDYQVAKAYMNNTRGISDHTMAVYGIKIDTENECIVFPQFTRDGKLRFLQKRKVGENYYGPKFINEGSAIKKDILFGLHLIDRFKFTPQRIKRVRMVESPIDVLSNYQVGVPAVATNGKLLFKQQVRELQLAGVEIVDTFFDSDEAGREATADAKKRLRRANIHVNEVLHPPELAFMKQDSNSLMLNGWLPYVQTKDVTIF